jgi:Protein of unknown function (DUF2442)
MKSALRGKHTSEVEVTNVSPQGFWILLDDRELFLPFETFPWFRDATVHQICLVERPSPHHLHWPQLDVDLAVESIDHPERFPLRSRIRPNQALPRREPPRGSSGRIEKSAGRRPRR